ncbi:hypothetical protein [Myroides odoratus]|uniref:hypothetical protein n=1 Tax=Myroides odoratus TaxID=256 RepID=UPI0039AF730D
MRTDISKYLFHGIRKPNLKHYPTQDEVPQFPLIDDDEFVSEFDILKNIIEEGAIRSSLSYRNGIPTVYGNQPVVCFTEMPLFNIIQYEKEHKKNPKISTYGIAVLKEDLFNIGGRPVISGLSVEVSKQISGQRILDESILPLNEQYRYVYLNLNSNAKTIDWTHEREWRVKVNTELIITNSLYDVYYEINGLNVFDLDSFKECVITVKTSVEAEEISEIVEHQLDRFRSYGSHDFSTKIKFLVLDEAIKTMQSDIECTSIENLPQSAFYTYKYDGLSREEEMRVINVIEECKNNAKIYAEEFIKDNTDILIENVEFKDICGYAYIQSYDMRNKYVRFLVKQEYMYANQDRGYTFDNLDLEIPFLQGLIYHEFIAKKQCEFLNKKIENLFSVYSIYD